LKTLVLNLPDTVDLDNKDVTLTIAAHLYEKGNISIGQAANMVGLSKRSFMEILGSYGVSIFNYPASDLHQDIENAKGNL
jgi:predicted HTH domain antitoxin